jgi:hypothetical protein
LTVMATLISLIPSTPLSPGNSTSSNCRNIGVRICPKFG